MAEIKVQEDSLSVESSIFDTSHPMEMEWRLKIFLEFLEVYLIRLAIETSRTRLPNSSGIATEESCQHMSRSTGKQYHSIAEKILTKMFAPFAAAATESDLVIRSIQLPGCPPLKAEVMQRLFDLCSNRNTGRIGMKAVSVVTTHATKVIVSPEGVPLASPHILLQLMFGESEPEAARRPASAPAASSSDPLRKTNNKKSSSKDKNGKLLKKKKTFSSSSKENLKKDIVDAAGGSPVLKRCNAKRDQIGHGPIRMNGISRPNVLSVQSSLNYNSTAPDIPSWPTSAEMEVNKVVLPSKLTTSRSRTTLTAPTRFDAMACIQRSNTIPKHELKRKHVFGMSSSLYSGSTVSILPADSSTSFAADDEHQQADTLIVDRAVIAYAAAGLGVIHDLNENRQTHYNGHTEDVTCMAISTDGSLAATGCNGKTPCVHIWDTNITDPTKALLILGVGFFYRGVCAVEFSYDNQFLVGVSCDDYHMVGIFNLINGDRVCEAHGQKGEAGHIMLWSFRRAQQARTVLTYASLRSKPLRMTNVVVGGSEGSVKVLLARSFVELHAFRLVEPIHPVPTTTTMTATLLPSQSTPSTSTFLKLDATFGSGHPSTTPLRRNSAAERLRRTLSTQRGVLLKKGAANSNSADKDDPTAEENRRKITGLAVANLNHSHIYIVATLGNGQAVRVMVVIVSSVAEFSFITIWVLCTASLCRVLGLSQAGRRFCATVGDDKQLILWDLCDCLLSISRACHIDRSKSIIAVGCTDGSITLYHVTDRPNEESNIKDDSNATKYLTEVAYRKDAHGECTEHYWLRHAIVLILIDVLHSQTVTQVAWTLIDYHTNSCWDVPTGKVNSTVNGADVRWRTRHCKLGFNVMGIWPPYSNGTEVNSLDVCVEKGLVATANNRSGLSQLFNYPCVVKSAPCKSYSGHSSHVMKIRFLLGGDMVATVGGRDASLQAWDCVP
eukprot:gene26244-34865_t